MRLTIPVAFILGILLFLLVFPWVIPLVSVIPGNLYLAPQHKNRIRGRMRFLRRILYSLRCAHARSAVYSAANSTPATGKMIQLVFQLSCDRLTARKIATVTHQ